MPTRCNGPSRTPRAGAHRRVIVESFLPGQGLPASWWSVAIAMVAVAERVPAHVIGDGEHTIAELVDMVNADPRRGVGHEKVLTRIKITAAVRNSWPNRASGWMTYPMPASRSHWRPPAT